MVAVERKKGQEKREVEWEGSSLIENKDREVKGGEWEGSGRR